MALNIKSAPAVKAQPKTPIQSIIVWSDAAILFFVVDGVFSAHKIHES